MSRYQVASNKAPPGMRVRVSGAVTSAGINLVKHAPVGSVLHRACPTGTCRCDAAFTRILSSRARCGDCKVHQGIEGAHGLQLEWQCLSGSDTCGRTGACAACLRDHYWDLTERMRKTHAERHAATGKDAGYGVLVRRFARDIPSVPALCRDGRGLIGYRFIFRRADAADVIAGYTGKGEGAFLMFNLFASNVQRRGFARLACRFPKALTRALSSLRGALLISVT
jgi:hypothetical protein